MLTSNVWTAMWAVSWVENVLVQNMKRPRGADIDPQVISYRWRGVLMSLYYCFRTHKTILFPSIFKVEGNKVVLFFHLRPMGRDMTVLSF